MAVPFLHDQLGANAYLRVRAAWGADHDREYLRELGIRYLAHRGPGSARQACVDLLAGHEDLIAEIARRFAAAASRGELLGSELPAVRVLKPLLGK